MNGNCFDEWQRVTDTGTGISGEIASINSFSAVVDWDDGSCTEVNYSDIEPETTLTLERIYNIQCEILRRMAKPRQIV